MASHPERIGKYQIRREIGAGAMGTVYEAFDPGIERRVAIKTIGTALRNELSESAVERFRREAQAAGRLQHPSIVGVYEFGQDGELAFIAMEYLEGVTLRELMRDANRRAQRLPLIDAYALARQLLLALDYSHRQGVVHRDLKPANLMVVDGRRLKIMDFGIARVGASSLTQTGAMMGTPTHMAPEQLIGREVDARADLWSAGVLLYEMLTGITPFGADTPVAVMHHVLQAEPPLPSVRVPELGAAFDAVVARALAKAPEGRFQTATDFAAALLAAHRGRPAAEAVKPTPPEAIHHTLSPEQTARYDRTGTVGAPMELPPLARVLSAQTLSDIETTLTRAIGPIARSLVQKAAERTTTLDTFYAMLAEHLPDDEERSAFLARIKRLDTGRATQTLPPPPAAPGGAATLPPRPALALDAATLQRCEQLLARHVGPLARVLVRRAANDSGDLRELYDKLAAQIDDEGERREFMKALRGK